MMPRLPAAPAFFHSRIGRIILFLLSFSVSFLVVWIVWKTTAVESWEIAAEPESLSSNFRPDGEIDIIPGIDCGTEVAHILPDYDNNPKSGSTDRLFTGYKCAGSRCAKSNGQSIEYCIEWCAKTDDCKAVAIGLNKKGGLAWCEGRRDATLTKVDKRRACIFMK